MNAKELKARIERAGLSHADCFEMNELRQRAREADAKIGTDDSSHSNENSNQNNQISHKSGRGKASGKKGRRSANTSSEPETISEEEAVLLERVEALVAESGKFGGRDAPMILADAEELKKQMENASLTTAGRKKMLDMIDEVNSSLAWENICEQKCGRFLHLGLLAVTLVPMLLTYLENLYEWALRPSMVVESADLTDMYAVVTGGCGALGLELAIMLANAGAGVVIGCHSTYDVVDIETRLSKLGLLHGSNRENGWVSVQPLRLESFKSVQEFATRVSKDVGILDILVHNAATKEGCVRTENGNEHVTQVNYLSPFLLTQLLLPKMREGSGRVVHLTCEAGLQQADWLPWPLGRTSPELLPHVDLENLEQWSKAKDLNAMQSSCDSSVQYANSKLAIVVHSHELNRRLFARSQGVSHVIDPGAMDSAFGRNSSVPTASSRRSSIMGNLPPVWIAKKIYSVTLGPIISSLGNFMLRSSIVGAKAVFHVATSSALASEDEGGGLFSDRAGAFMECGKPPALCGRVESYKLPAVTMDEQLAEQLWDRTEIAIGRRYLRSQ